MSAAPDPRAETPRVDIRRVEAADLPALGALLATVDAFRPDEVDCAIEVVEEHLRGDLEYHPYLLWEGEAAAGFLCFGPVPLTAGTFDLYWIAVGAGFRGRGHGRLLMDHLVDRSRAAGARMIVIETSSQPSHAGACALYRSCGFTEAARIASYYAPGDDLLIFTRALEPAPAAGEGGTP